MSAAKKKAPRRGRPSLPKGEGRVVLVAQRVTPDTLRYLERAAPTAGGIGRVIDAAVIALDDLTRRMERGGLARPRNNPAQTRHE